MGYGVENLNISYPILLFLIKAIITFLTAAVESIFFLMIISEVREKTILQAHMLA